MYVNMSVFMGIMCFCVFLCHFDMVLHVFSCQIYYITANYHMSTFYVTVLTLFRVWSYMAYYRPEGLDD